MTVRGLCVFPLALCACSRFLPSTDVFATPDIPGDFPQLEAFEDGRAELVVDGEPRTTKDGGGTIYDPGGLDPDDLPATMSFDYLLYLDFLEPKEGIYTAAEGALTASWNGFELNQSCGTGTLNILGESRSVEKLTGIATVAIWGTLQLELCDQDSSPARLEISGRFSSTVREI